MKHNKIQKLVLAALFAALDCVATMVISIPIPATNGYINLGDGFVLLGAFLLGPVYGMAAGGSIPANAVQGAAGLAVSIVCCKALRAIPSFRKICC